MLAHGLAIRVVLAIARVVVAVEDMVAEAVVGGVIAEEEMDVADVGESKEVKTQRLAVHRPSRRTSRQLHQRQLPQRVRNRRFVAGLHPALHPFKHFFELLISRRVSAFLC